MGPSRISYTREAGRVVEKIGSRPRKTPLVWGWENAEYGYSRHRNQPSFELLRRVYGPFLGFFMRVEVEASFMVLCWGVACCTKFTEFDASVELRSAQAKNLRLTRLGHPLQLPSLQFSCFGR